MEPIKDIGQIEIVSQTRLVWRIPNFYNLPQVNDTVIRSPRLKNNDRDWYMEVYPNGRRLYCSLGWFGISAFNLIFESCVRNVCIGVSSSANMIFSNEESHGDGFYCCTRLIPTSLFNSWKDIFAPEGDLHLYINTEEDHLPVDTIYFALRTDDVQKLFQSNLENLCRGTSLQPEEKKELPTETTVGELDIDSTRIKWIIPNFSDLLHKNDTVIRSRRFHSGAGDWYIEVYPHGQSVYSSLGWFGIAVCPLNSDLTLRCTSFAIYEENYQIYFELKANSQNKRFSCSKLLPTSLLKSWQDVIAPGDNLHLIFFFDDDEKEDGMVTSFKMRISKETMQRWYRQKFENADICKEPSTQTEDEIVKGGLEQTDDGASTEKTSETEKGVEKMRRNLQKIESVVQNAANLYAMANMYHGQQLNEAKESCKKVMMTNISIDNFCDLFALSLQHDEKELKDACIHFFAKHSLDIIKMDKWQTFFNENPKPGHELLIKHSKLNK